MCRRAVGFDVGADRGVTFNIVESIPLGVDLTTDMSFFQAMYDTVNSAQHEVMIACMYVPPRALRARSLPDRGGKPCLHAVGGHLTPLYRVQVHDVFQ